MGLFDRFKKKPAEPVGPQPPQEDTMALLLMDRLLPDVKPAAEILRSVFGENAVSDVDDSHPRVPAFIATVEGLEFWVSYLPMPVPPQTDDIAMEAKYNLFLSPEEKEAFTNNKSFWMLAQKGGGKTLEDKRKVCWCFSLLCCALLELEGAIGIHPINRGGLLVSKRSYLHHRELMDKYTRENDVGYFPIPLWVWIYGTEQEGKPVLLTSGLKDFGLPELGFFNPQRNVDELVNFLCTLASRHLTGRDHYENRTLVPLDEKTEVVCKQEGDTLFFIGA